MIAAVVAVLGAWLGFANPLGSFGPLVLLYPAGLFRLAADLEGGDRPWRRVFGRTWLVATIALAGCLYWTALPVANFSTLPLALAWPCPILLSMVLAVFPALAACCARLGGMSMGPWGAGLLAGSAWASMEIVLNYIFTGFPWIVLPAALSFTPALLQPAALVGGIGVSLAWAVAAGWLALPQTRLVTAPRLVAIGLLVLLAGFGVWRMDTKTPETARGTVGMVQGNVDQSIKWNEAYLAKTLRKYMNQTRVLTLEHDPELVVWPETALPFYFQDTTPASAEIRTFVDALDLRLLTGTPAYDYAPATETVTLYNRAVALGESGRDAGRYDKQHLVPFGEYMPFGWLIPFEKIVEGAGDYSAGPNDGPIRMGPFLCGVLICYETIFPELAQARVADGATLLVNISNDAWFGRSSAPWQHLSLSVVRAVEQQRWLVRATNTGVSTFVDPHGRIHEPTELFTTTALAMEVGAVAERTFFSRHFAAIYAAIALLFAGLCTRAILTYKRGFKKIT
jgi:apolipoprotein N-acyltransferase